MDALDGYGSSSSSSSYDGQLSGDPPVFHGPAAAAAAVRHKPSGPQQQQQQHPHRGKKILSLASILPQHILDRWTRQHDAPGDYSDSNDEDDVDVDAPSLSRGLPKTSDNEQISSSVSSNYRSPEIAALLRDLPKVQHGNNHKKFQHSRRKTARDFPEKERLGAAFLTSVVTTVDAKKTTIGNTVRDIHGEEPQDDAVGAKDYDLDISVNGTVEQVSPSNGRVDLAKPAVSSASTHYIQRINAAPRIQVAPSAAAPAPSKKQKSICAPCPPPAFTSNSKRSRKEMERALRQGNVSQVVQNNPQLLTHVDSADPTAFALDALPASSTATTSVRNVPTPLYDSSLGSTTTSHKGGRNNPIRQLLSQAVHLEQQRLQQPSSSSVSSTGQQVKLHRANAKRKYGW